MDERDLDVRNWGIADKYEAGGTLLTISLEYTISRERVRQLLKRMGVQMRRRGYAVGSRKMGEETTEA